MRILVQKFGGTSLSTADAREQAVQHIRHASNKYSVVVVVSAMGRRGDPYATDSLFSAMGDHAYLLPARERDLLLACGEIISASVLCAMLHASGLPATVLTGGQAGIITDDSYGHARIKRIDSARIRQLLGAGEVVIVTGFQGSSESGEMTTLGRGGSDTTATALGAALQADFVDIYTDVEGILTADPKLVKDAKPLVSISYAEACNIANHGAKVIHPRAVEIAMQAQMPVRVRSTFSRRKGTLVKAAARKGEPFADRLVTSIAYREDITQIQIAPLDGQLDLQLQVFQTMAREHISVDFINVNPSGVVYTVHDQEAERATAALHHMGYLPNVLPHCAKVSVIGGGINGVPGIMSRIVTALSNQNIQILQSADSNTTIWVLVRKEDMAQSLRALHDEFQLAKG